MYIEPFILVIGLISLVKGSDYLVSSSSSLARNFGVSDLLIGLTLVSIGTSLPEFLTAVFASIDGFSGIIVGDVVGSNICNIALILGFSSILYPVDLTKVGHPANSENRFKKSKSYRDYIIMIIASILFFLFSLNGEIYFIEGIIFLSFFICYMYLLVRNEKDILIYDTLGDPTNQTMGTRQKKGNLAKTFFIFIISLLFILLGANLTVDGAKGIAVLLGVSDELIAMILIAVGTSLPEFAVTLSSLKKKNTSIALGNIIGSNIFNILFIIGISSIINPIIVSVDSRFVAMPFMLITSFMLLFILRDQKIRRYEGVLLFFVYIIFLYAYIF